MNINDYSVSHKTYGLGKVTDLYGDRIVAQFDCGTKVFNFPKAFTDQFLKTDNPELLSRLEQANAEKQQIAAQKPPCQTNKKNRTSHQILFCNIAWMNEYRGVTHKDIPINGGSYVDETQSAGESTNFMPISIEAEDGTLQNFMLGKFETKTTKGVTRNQTHIEKIAGCQAFAKEPYAEGCIVVWCAAQPSGGSKVVGWYKNATVCRNYESLFLKYKDGYEEELMYNVLCEEADAVLLPVAERENAKWDVPRRKGKSGPPFGFFRSNVWYASEPEAREYVEALVQNIENYTAAIKK